MSSNSNALQGSALSWFHACAYNKRISEPASRHRPVMATHPTTVSANAATQSVIGNSHQDSMEHSGMPARRFGHVIVMAGASCAGKTTLTERLLAGELPALSEAVALVPNGAYHVVHGRDWKRVEASASVNVLVQYDVTARTPFADEGHVGDTTLALLNGAERLTLLTVWEHPDELRRRLEGRFDARGGLAYTLLQGLRRRGLQPALYSFRRFRQRRRLFVQPDALWSLYERWFASCARMQVSSHWVVRSTNANDPLRLCEPFPDSPFWRP